MSYSVARNLSRKFGAISIFALFVCTNANANVCPTKCRGLNSNTFFPECSNCTSYSDFTLGNTLYTNTVATNTATPDLISASYRAGQNSVNEIQRQSAAQAAALARSQGDGCDDEDNDRIIAELALCSTHAYNIGLDKNPDSASDKQLIKDAVALKTTVMTQQMNKQYEYIESMMKRFKTQLEKAVLTTKLQAAGAPTGSNTSSGGSSSSGGSYSGGSSGSGNVRNQTPGIFVEGAENCEIIFDTLELYKCLANNYQLIYDQSKGGQTVTRELRQQLANDFKLLIANKPANITIQPTSDTEQQACQNESRLSSSGRSMFSKCLTGHITNIRNANTQYTRENKQPAK